MTQAQSKNIDFYKQLHSQGVYGVTSHALGSLIQFSIAELNAQKIIDYGCGQSQLASSLITSGGEPIVRYDPAIPEIANKPSDRFELLINTDVLEHIPEPELDAVLADMASLSVKAYFNISLCESKTVLSDGSNAHCTVCPSGWWLERIRRYFPEAKIIYDQPNKECGIVSWPTPYAVGYQAIYKHIIENKRLHKALKKAQPFYKKWPRKWRNSINKRLRTS